MTRQQLLDLYFIDARARLIDLAAFVDRIERADGPADFRLAAFQNALSILQKNESERARRILLAFSDLTSEPRTAATTKGACGASDPTLR